MLLAIDIGNTNIVFAVFGKDGTIKANFRLSTDSSKTADEYYLQIRSLLEFYNLNVMTIERVSLASVVPPVDILLEDVFRKYFTHINVVNLTVDMIPLRINLLNPWEVGIDRVLNAFMGLEISRQNTIIIDFGTATTFDVVLQNGSYEGGIICAGINLLSNALNLKTAKLPRVSFKEVESVTGKTTTEAIRSGLYFGYKHLVSGLTKQIKEEYNQDFYVIATGGLAPVICESKDVNLIDQNLTLKGIYQLSC